MTRVIDPIDGECKYTQNPTKQSKTVDECLRPFRWALLVQAISDNSIEDPCQVSSILLSEIAIIRNTLTKRGRRPLSRVFKVIILKKLKKA
ncbi:MAG: hypothetical protein FWC11_00875 [Firmicutes bacterium]|nr:hypothetical protein [Bacillota bacterium]